jgi:hypothetical protein
MSVPTPLDFILLMLWAAGQFFAVWGIIIGRREDRLAKHVGKLYGVLGLALQAPIFAALFGMLGDGYNDQGIVTWGVGSIPTVLALIALALGFRPARQG